MVFQRVATSQAQIGHLNQSAALQGATASYITIACPKCGEEYFHWSTSLPTDPQGGDGSAFVSRQRSAAAKLLGQQCRRHTDWIRV
jgi:hypothetical protein